MTDTRTGSITTTGHSDSTPFPRMVRFAPAVPHAIIGAIVALTELGGPDRSDAIHLALTTYLDGDNNLAGDPDIIGRLGAAA